MEGKFLGNTPVAPEMHHHDLPRRSNFEEGDIWKCTVCEKMYRKEWRNFQYDPETQESRDDGWYWIEYIGPIERSRP